MQAIVVGEGKGQLVVVKPKPERVQRKTIDNNGVFLGNKDSAHELLQDLAILLQDAFFPLIFQTFQKLGWVLGISANTW